MKKKRPAFKIEKQSELLYGVHPVLECLRAKKRRIISLYTTRPEPKGWHRIVPHLPKKLSNIQYVTRDVLTRMTGTNDHMGVVAWVEPYRYATQQFTPDDKPRLLLLDGVQDVRNLGAILRSAYCTQVDGVILAKKNTAPMTAAVFKAAAGLCEHLDIFLVPSLSSAIKELQRVGYTFYMAVINDGKKATEVTYKKPHCLVIGSEETGISKEVRSLGTPITLPQKDTSSYNASVAAGILLFITQYSK